MESQRWPDANPQKRRQSVSQVDIIIKQTRKRGCNSGLGTIHLYSEVQSSSVQSLSRLWLFVTPLTAAQQAYLSITNSRSLLKLMFIESVMPSNHLILCRPLLLPPSIFSHIRVFQINQFFALGSQSTGVSASASILPMDIQDWFLLEWTGGTSLRAFLIRSWGQIRLKAALIRVPGSPTHSIPLAPHTGDLQVMCLFTWYIPEQEEEMSMTPVFLLR